MTQAQDPRDVIRNMDVGPSVAATPTTDSISSADAVLAKTRADAFGQEALSDEVLLRSGAQKGKDIVRARRMQQRAARTAADATLEHATREMAYGRHRNGYRKRDGSKYTIDDAANSYMFAPEEFADVEVRKDDGSLHGIIKVHHNYLPQRLDRGHLSVADANALFEENRLAKDGARLAAFEAGTNPTELMRYVEANKATNDIARRGSQLAQTRLLLSEDMDVFEKANVLLNERMVGGFARGTAKLFYEMPTSLYETALQNSLAMSDWYNRTFGKRRGATEARLDLNTARDYGSVDELFQQEFGFGSQPVVTNLRGYETLGQVAEAAPSFIAQIAGGIATGGATTLPALFRAPGFLVSSFAIAAAQTNNERLRFYTEQGMDPKLAGVNALIDSFTAGTMAALSTRFIAGGQSMLFQSALGRRAMAAASRRGATRLLADSANGFIEEGSQEYLEGIMFDGVQAMLKGTLDRSEEDVFYDGYFKDKLQDFLVGGILGSAAGGSLGNMSLTNRINALEASVLGQYQYRDPSKTGRFEVGQPATFIDGTTMTNPDGSPVGSVTAENQAEVQKRWRDDVAQKTFMYQNGYGVEGLPRMKTQERERSLWQRLTGIGESAVGDMLHTFGSSDEFYEAEDGTKHRRVEMAENMPDAAYALSGEENPSDSGESDKSAPKYQTPKSNRQSDWEAAGLGWMGKGLTDQQRQELMDEAKASVERQARKISQRQDRIAAAQDQVADGALPDVSGGQALSPEQAIATADMMAEGLTDYYRNLGYSQSEAEALAGEKRAELLSGNVSEETKDLLVRAMGGNATAEQYIDAVAQSVTNMPQSQRQIIAQISSLQSLTPQALLDIDRAEPALPSSEQEIITEAALAGENGSPAQKTVLAKISERLAAAGFVVSSPAGLSDRFRKVLQSFAENGRQVVIVANPDKSGVNGFYDPETGLVAINESSPAYLQAIEQEREADYIATIVLLHEGTHAIQHESSGKIQGIVQAISALDSTLLEDGAVRAMEAMGLIEPGAGTKAAANALLQNPQYVREVLAYTVENMARGRSKGELATLLRRVSGGKKTLTDRLRLLKDSVLSIAGVSGAGELSVLFDVAEEVGATLGRTRGAKADAKASTGFDSTIEPAVELGLSAASTTFDDINLRGEVPVTDALNAIALASAASQSSPLSEDDFRGEEPEPETLTVEQFVELTISASAARAADVRPAEQTPEDKKAGGRRRNILRGAEARRRISQDSNKTLPVQGAEVNVDVPDPAKQAKPQTETERRVSGLMLTVRETMNDETADDADLLSALEMVQMLESQVTDEKQQTELSKMADELTQRVAGLSEGSDAIERQAAEDPDLTPEEEEFYNGFERFGDYDARREMDPEEFEFSLASPTNPVGIENRMLSAFGRNNIEAHRGMISGNWITGADAREGVIDGLRGKVNTRDIPQDAEFFMLPGTNYGYAATFEQGNDTLNVNVIRYNAVSTVPDSAFDGRFPFEMIALHALQTAGDRATSQSVSVNFADMKMTGKAKQNLKMRRAAIEMMGGNGSEQRIGVGKRTAERAYEIAFGRWATNREGDRVIGFSGTDNLHIFLRNSDEASLEGSGGRVPEHIEQAVIRGDENQLEAIVVKDFKGGVAQGLATMFAKARFAKQYVSGPTRIADRSARELNRTFSVMAQMDGGYRKVDPVAKQMDSLERILKTLDPEAMDANPDLVMMFIAAAARTEVDAKAIALGLAAYNHHRINKSLLNATQDAVDNPFPFNIGRGMSVGQYERLMYVSANADELTLADLTEVGELGKFDAVRRDEIRPLQEVVVSRGGEFTTMEVRDRLRGMGSNKSIRRADLHFTLAGSEFLAVAADRSYQPITPGHVAMWNASKGFRIGYEGNIQDSLDLARRLLMNRKADTDTGPFLLMDLLYSDSNLLQYLDLIASQKVNRSNTPRGLSRIADRLAGRSGNSARPSTPRSRSEGVAIRQDVENLRGRNINTEAIAIGHGSGFNVAGAAVELMESLADRNSTVDFIAEGFEYSLGQLPKSITSVEFEVESGPDGRTEAYVYTTEKGQQIKTVISSYEPVPDFFEHNLSFFMNQDASLVGWDHSDSYERRMALTIPKLMARMVEDRVARGENGGVRLDGLSLSIELESGNSQRLNYKSFLLRAARHMAYKTGVPHAVLVGVTIDDRGDVQGNMVVMPTNRHDALAAFDQGNEFGGVFTDQQSRKTVRQDRRSGFADFATLQMEMTIVNPEEQTLEPQKSAVFEHLSQTGVSMTSTDVDNFLHAVKVQEQKDAEFEAEQQESPFAALGEEEPNWEEDFEYSLTPESAARVFDMFDSIKFRAGDGTLVLEHKGFPQKSGYDQPPDFTLTVTVGQSIAFKLSGGMSTGYADVNWEKIAEKTGYPEYKRLGLAIFGRIVPAWTQTVMSQKEEAPETFASFSGPKGRMNYIPMFVRIAERLSKKHGMPYAVIGEIANMEFDTTDGTFTEAMGYVKIVPLLSDPNLTDIEAEIVANERRLPTDGVILSENFNFKEHVNDIVDVAKATGRDYATPHKKLPAIIVGMEAKTRAGYKDTAIHPFFAATRREIGKAARPIAKQKIDARIARGARLTDTDRENELLVAVHGLKPFPTAQIRATLAQMSKAGEVDLDFEYSLSMDSVRSTRDFAGRFIKSHFHKEGNLPEEIFDMKLRKDAEIRADLERARYNNAELKKAINAIPAEKRPKLAVVNEALTTNDFSALESFPEVVKAGQSMRAHIKKMSKRLIDEGVVEGQLAARIDKNGDTYLHRSYRVFDDPNWASKVPEEVRNNAKAKLREQFPEASEDQIEQMIGELLYSGKAAESPMAILASTTKIGGKDLSILMGRKDIPDWLMALWGEYDDPFINYTKSIGKIATLAANHKFLTTVREFGLASGLFSDLQSGKVDPTHVAEFATKSSMAFAPLNGLRTTPELKQAFEEAAANTHIDQWWLRNYMKFNSGVKWSKTIGSPLTHLRNLVGNLGFAVANGHIPNGSVKLKDLVGVTGLFGARPEDAQEKYEEYVRLGVVQSGSFREVFDAVQEAGGLSVEEWANRWAERGGARAAASKAAKAAQGTVEFMNKAYMAEDDIWKIFAYETELKRYSDAYAKSGQPVPDTLKQDVAKIIQNTYPNYDNVPKFIKGLRQVPFMGTFTSFPWEVGRTAVNRILLTHKELRSDNPEIRKIGMQRAVGQLSAIMGAYVLQEVAAAILGFDDEEQEAVRQLAAPWNENSPMVLLPGDDGKVRFIDLGYVDPHSYFTKPLMALFRADDIGVKKALISAVDEILDPFFGEEILFGRILDVARNKKRSGSQVYLDAAPLTQRVLEGGKYILGAIEPGLVDQFIRTPYRAVMGYTNDYGKTYSLPYHLFQQTTGLKIETIDPRQAFSFRAATFARNESSLTGHLRKVAGRRGTVGEGELASTYAMVNRNRQQNMDAFQKQINALVALGVKPKEVAAILKQANVSKKHIPALISGKHIPVQIDDNYLDRQFARSVVQTPDAPLSKMTEVRRRLEVLRRAQQAASE